jgi:hypothetical protein
MTYFKTRDISAIALSGALWAIVNWSVAPIFWELTHLPILCDMVGVSLLIITVWWTRKLGSTTLMGIIATILNFMFRPGATHFVGFLAASALFDGLTKVVGYRNSLSKRFLGSFCLVLFSFLSTILAGVIIGTFFMNPLFLSNMFGGVVFFALLHGVGGLIGGIFGVTIVRGLERRGISVYEPFNQLNYSQRNLLCARVN